MRRKGASRKFRGARVPLHFLALMGSRLALGAPPSYLLAYQEAGFRYANFARSASSGSDIGNTPEQASFPHAMMCLSAS